MNSSALKGIAPSAVRDTMLLRVEMNILRDNKMYMERKKGVLGIITVITPYFIPTCLRVLLKQM